MSLETKHAWWTGSHCCWFPARSGPDSRGPPLRAAPHPNSWPASNKRRCQTTKHNLKPEIITMYSPHYLDAVFKYVPWQQKSLFLISWLAEDDQLLEQEDTPLPCSGQEAGFLLADRESILLEQLPLSCDFPLKHHTHRQTAESYSQQPAKSLLGHSVPQSLGVFPHSSCHYNALAQNTSPPLHSGRTNSKKIKELLEGEKKIFVCPQRVSTWSSSTSRPALL